MSFCTVKDNIIRVHHGQEVTEWHVDLALQSCSQTNSGGLQEGAEVICFLRNEEKREKKRRTRCEFSPFKEKRVSRFRTNGKVMDHIKIDGNENDKNQVINATMHVHIKGSPPDWSLLIS